MSKFFKLSALALVSLTFLTGCNQLDRAIKGDEYADAKLAAQKAEERITKLNQDSTVFPQLSEEVAENEAAVIMHTSKGDITIKLFPEEAPLAVENFLTHAKDGYYNGVIFHRVISDFMIQSGDPQGDGTGGQSIWKDKDSSIDQGFGFKNEISDYLYNIRGALSMANAGPDTNGSQFFIVQNQQDWSSQLDTQIYPKKIIEAYQKGGFPAPTGGDGNYTVFGQVIKGMDVVDSIATVETDSSDKPLEAITIDSIEIIKDYNFAK
ncbi:peptidylprolyl isomerase [Streptococcus plurextorum]|uniref:peptidylprolyl isomerase n=1 Tax=Streptococcus plurextorum TaxID=456876 RepID=UPI0003FC5CEA|nr:peptidylprolyl isomerase [Streptococcus plurextorum]